MNNIEIYILLNYIKINKILYIVKLKIYFIKLFRMNYTVFKVSLLIILDYYFLILNILLYQDNT